MYSITVLMSSYNGEKFIAEQINSILNQKECKVTLIVRDDGSSDGTLNILEQYQLEGKLVWYSDGENLRPARSFLRLLANAPDSDYYAFADQDDYWMPDKLIRAVKCLETQDDIPVVYYANAELVDASLNSYNQTVYCGKQTPSLLMTLCCSDIMGCLMVFNRRIRDIFCQRSIETLNIGMHDYFIAQLCNACGGKVIYDDNVVMKYRQHGQNVVGCQVKKERLALYRVIYRLMKTYEVTIDQDADNLFTYETFINAESLCLIRKISKYRKNIFTRIELFGRLIWVYLSKKATKSAVIVAIRILCGKA